MEFNKQSFYAKFKKKLDELNEHTSYLGSLEYNEMYSGKKSPYFDENEFIASSVLVATIKELSLWIVSATEQLGLTVLRDRFIEEMKEFNGKEGYIELVPWFDSEYSPAAEVLERYLNAITSDCDQLDITKKKETRSSLEVIRTYLANAGFLLNSLKIEPTSEHQVHLPLYANLKSIFPDTKIKYVIQKTNKNYEIDIMLPKEKIGIEVKFAKSEKDVKNQIDELYTDMVGYEEKNKKISYFALMYMDSQYVTKEQIAETLKENNCPVHWEIILVVNTIGKKLKR